MALATCNRCKQQFAAANRLCSYCGAQNESVVSTDELIATAGKRNYDVFLLGIPVVATLLTWLWVGNMSLLQSPDSALLLLAILTAVGTAAAAGMEANALSLENNRQGSYAPITWFALIVMLWVLAYPFYLYKRKDYGASNLIGVGIALTLIMSASVAGMNYRIDVKRAELRQLFASDPFATRSTPGGNTARTVSPENFWQAAAANTIDKYQIAKKNNALIDACVKATQIATQFMEAKDEAHYQEWSAIRKKDCAAAGTPDE